MSEHMAKRQDAQERLGEMTENRTSEASWLKEFSQAELPCGQIDASLFETRFISMATDGHRSFQFEHCVIATIISVLLTPLVKRHEHCQWNPYPSRNPPHL